MTEEHGGSGGNFGERGARGRERLGDLGHVRDVVGVDALDGEPTGVVAVAVAPLRMAHRGPRVEALGGRGAVGRVGVPHYEAITAGGPTFFNNITVSGGPAPVRVYIEDLLPDILEGRIEPGRVFDRTVGLDEVPGGYDAMDQRKALKVLIKP